MKVSRRKKKYFKEHFNTILQKCLEMNIDKLMVRKNSHRGRCTIQPHFNGVFFVMNSARNFQMIINRDPITANL